MEEELYDAAGNRIFRKKEKKIEDMTRQEIKKMKKLLKDKIKQGVELEEFEMDYCDEWNIKFDYVE